MIFLFSIVVRENSEANKQSDVPKTLGKCKTIDYIVWKSRKDDFSKKIAYPTHRLCCMQFEKLELLCT